MVTPVYTRTLFIGFVVASLGVALPAQAQNGIFLSGVGPVNRSMGGAATAAPLDAAGALYWNPATMSAFPSSEAVLGAELILPRAHLSSRINANALGPGFPPVTLFGSDRSESGVTPVPTIAIIAKPEESVWTYGVGVFGVAGFRSNYPASDNNPILTAQPPNGLGLGRIEAQAQILQFVPAAALQLTDRLSIGVGPTITMADVAAEPGFFGAPDDANSDGFFTYAPATGSRYFWGGGVQAGIYYELTDSWHFGASLKSPQWFETFRFKSNDEIGGSRTLTFDFDLPLVASLGAAYTGLERFTFAVDARYFDYANTDGFGDSGFTSTGKVRGLGWRSIFAVAAGVQYALCECTSLRLGYSFNENPIPDSNTMINAGVPLQLQHTLYAGASHRLSRNMDIHIAYAHAFNSEISGFFVTPLGPLPGTSVTSDVAVDSVTVGATIRF